MIQQKEVTGIEAFEYLLTQLKLGGKSLSNLISILPLNDGKVYSFVPEETSKKSLYKFESGGIYFFDKEVPNNQQKLLPIRNDSKQVLIDIIYEYINNASYNCCIFEEPNAKPSDPSVLNSKIKYLYKGDEIFYFYDKKNNNKSLIEKTLKISDGYYFLCILSFVRFDGQVKFPSFGEVDLELLKIIVQNLSCFFVKAYDGEGYLMWSKQ